MAGGAFDKDFGYLMPFLDKIAEAATTLPDPAAREEMKRLVAGEKQRWTRIRQLLAGAESKPVDAGGASTNSPAGGTGSSQHLNAAATAPQTTVGQRFTQQFTVGSLRPRERS